MAEKVPASHAVHTLASDARATLLYQPTTQDVQLEAAWGVLYRPSTHEVQKLARPAVTFALYAPTPHTVHTSDVMAATTRP